MGFSYSSLTNLLAEFGRDRLHEQANLSFALLKEKVLDVEDLPEEVSTIQVKNGGFGSVGTVADGGTLPDAGDIDFLKGTFGPVYTVGRIKFPIGITKIASSRKGVKVFNEAVDTAGKDLGRTLDRSLITAQIGSPSGAQSAGATTWSVSDPSGYRPGASVDIYTTGDVFKETRRTTNIVFNEDGTGTITCDALVNALATSDKIYLRGQGASATRMTNFGDIVTSGGSLYGLTSAQFTPGTSNSTITTWGNTDVGGLVDRCAIRSGSRPTAIVCNSVARRRIHDSMNPQVTFGPADDLDVYSKKRRLMFDGIPIVVDENMPSAYYDFWNKEQCYLHRHFDFAPDTDGPSKGSWSKESLMLSQTSYAHVLQVSGGHNLGCKMRVAFIRMTGVTA